MLLEFDLDLDLDKDLEFSLTNLTGDLAEEHAPWSLVDVDLDLDLETGELLRLLERLLTERLLTEADLDLLLLLLELFEGVLLALGFFLDFSGLSDLLEDLALLFGEVFGLLDLEEEGEEAEEEEEDRTVLADFLLLLLQDRFFDETFSSSSFSLWALKRSATTGSARKEWSLLATTESFTSAILH